jgi:hypothetical protein
VKTEKKNDKWWLTLDETKDGLEKAPGFTYEKASTTWAREEVTSKSQIRVARRASGALLLLPLLFLAQLSDEPPFESAISSCSFGAYVVTCLTDSISAKSARWPKRPEHLDQKSTGLRGWRAVDGQPERCTGDAGL